jgi:hypothetical protein
MLQIRHEPSGHILILQITYTTKLYFSLFSCSLQHANTRIKFLLCTHPQVAFNAENDKQISIEYDKLIFQGQNPVK